MQERPTVESAVPPAPAQNRNAAHLKLLADISRILIAGDNLHDLLTQVLERTVTVTGATRGSILLLDPQSDEGNMIRAGAGVFSATSQVTRILREGAASHAITSHQPVLIHDTANDPRWIPSTIDHQRPAPRSALVVPLLDDETVKGVLTLWHISPGFFDQNAVELLTTIAAQAAIAIERTAAYEQIRQRAEELDQLYQEREQLYKQEYRHRHNLAMLYEASLTIAAAESLSDVLLRFRECVTQLALVDESYVFLYDVDMGRLSRANPHQPAATISPYQAMASRLAGQAVAAGSAVLYQTPGTAGLHSSAIAIPLISNAVCRGVLVLLRNGSEQQTAFSQSEQQLIESLCASVAVAITNAQFLRATRRQLQRMQALARLSTPLSAFMEPLPAVEAVVYEGMIELEAECCLVFLTAEESDNLQPALKLGNHQAVSTSLISTIVLEQLPIFNNGVASIPDLAQLPPPGQHDELVGPELRSGLAFELRDQNSRCGLLLLLYREVRVFAAAEIECGRILANITVATLHNARLYKDLRQSNAALLQANRLKSEFLATVSHELRTPLSNITGYTEMLQEGFYGPLSAELQDPLQRIQRNARQLLSQVEDVLDLSMLEAGYVQINVEQCNLQRLFLDLLAVFMPQAEERALQLHAMVDAQIGIIATDTARLRQILYHLLENAVKYTEAGRIDVIAQVQPDKADRLAIEVRDTGIGIPDEMQQSIFEEFRRIDASTTRQRGGIGIGLAIVYRLARLLGGSVSLQSKINAGSCFRIELPLNR